jgi:hypothetical protein
MMKNRNHTLERIPGSSPSSPDQERFHGFLSISMETDDSGRCCYLAAEVPDAATGQREAA